MSYFITALVFILIFSILVLIHELGHFITAKRAGIKVEEFGFGLPPRLWGKKKGETIYSVNWIPFGGFVRMLGEDSTDKKSLENKRSFAAQNPWVRIKVVCAGVFMNFILAWLLLSIAFTFGTKPFLSPASSGDSDFILGPDQIAEAIDSGLIELDLGLSISEVVVASLAEESGFEKGDYLVMIDGRYLSASALNDIVSGDYVHKYGVIRNDQLVEISVSGQADELGLNFSEYGAFPWLSFKEVKEGTALYDAGLRSGDLLLAVNDQIVHSVEDFEEKSKTGFFNFEIFDGSTYKNVNFENTGFSVVVSDVFEGLSADESGILVGDELLSINGEEFDSVEGAISLIGSSNGEVMTFQVKRAADILDLKLSTDENNVVGVALSAATSYGAFEGATFATQDILTSSKLNEISYPPHVAIYKALGETVSMSKFTALMFVDFLRGLVVSGEIPDEVSGPVGIATMTHGFVEEGFIPVLVFMAILSLSLAAINILPIPALDGGRLLFILIEVFFGKKINEKKEAYIHMLGYVLILLLILVVTYSDIAKLWH